MTRFWGSELKTNCAKQNLDLKQRNVLLSFNETMEAAVKAS
jgi:hypothetical protein